jgi:hypothetical protein
MVGVRANWEKGPKKRTDRTIVPQYRIIQLRLLCLETMLLLHCSAHIKLHFNIKETQTTSACRFFLMGIAFIYESTVYTSQLRNSKAFLFRIKQSAPQTLNLYHHRRLSQ